MRRIVARVQAYRYDDMVDASVTRIPSQSGVSRPVNVKVIDDEPDDVWGPILQRIADAAGMDKYVTDFFTSDHINFTLFSE